MQKFDSSGNFLRAWGKDVDQPARREAWDRARDLHGGRGLPGGEQPDSTALGGEGSTTPGEIAVETTAVRLQTSTSADGDGSNNRDPEVRLDGQLPAGLGQERDRRAAAPRLRICTVAADCQAARRRTGWRDRHSPKSSPQTQQATSTSPTATTESRGSTPGNFRGPGARTWSAAAAPGFEICTVAADCKSGVRTALGGERTTASKASPPTRPGMSTYPTAL